MSDDQAVFRPPSLPPPAFVAPPVFEPPPLNPAEVQRFRILRDSISRTSAEDAEMAAFAERERPGAAVQPDPLSPAEIGRLAELRAETEVDDGEKAEMAALVAREHLAPRPVPLEPNPELVAGLMQLTMGRLVALVERMASTPPFTLGITAQMRALREGFDLAVFHGSPRADPPPPPALPALDETARRARIAQLEANHNRMVSEDQELARLYRDRGV